MVIDCSNDIAKHVVVESRRSVALLIYPVICYRFSEMKKSGSMPNKPPPPIPRNASNKLPVASAVAVDTGFSHNCSSLSASLDSMPAIDMDFSDLLRETKEKFTTQMCKETPGVTYDVPVNEVEYMIPAQLVNSQYTSSWHANSSTYQLLTCQLFNISTLQHINSSTYQLLTCQLFNISTLQHINSSTYQLFNISTLQHINSSTYQLFNISALQHINSSTYQLFNISTLDISALQHFNASTDTVGI